MREKDESSTAQEISPLRIIQKCSFGDLSPNECANIFFWNQKYIKYELETWELFDKDIKMKNSK